MTDTALFTPASANQYALWDAPPRLALRWPALENSTIPTRIIERTAMQPSAITSAEPRSPATRRRLSGCRTSISQDFRQDRGGGPPPEGGSPRWRTTQ